MLAIYILYSLTTLALSLSGWFGTSYFILKYKKLSYLPCFSIGLLLFLVAFLFYGLFLFYSGIFNRITIITPLLLLSPFAFRFVKTADMEVKILLLIFISLFSIGILLQTFLPYYPLGGDWFLHYQASSEYISNGKITFLSGRPPIFNFLGSMYLEIFSDNFWVFQIASVFLSSLFIIPLYLIAKNFDRKVAIITIVFAVLNSFILQNTIYTWPKNLATFFVLFFFYFIMKNQALLSILPATFALYTSPISLFFLPAGYIYGYLKKNKNLSKSILIVILIFSPFVIYSVLKTGSSETTPFILYTIAVNGIEKLETEPISKTFTDFLSRPLYHLIGIRSINFIMTTFPMLLLLKFSALFTEFPIIQIQKTVVISQVPLLYHFMHSIPGSLSTLVYIFSLRGLYKLFKENRDMFLLIVLPLIFAIVYWGWIKAGIINDLLQPLVPMLIMVAVSQMKSKKIVYLSLCLMLLEGVIFAYVYSSSIPAFISTTTNQQILSVDSINRIL